MKKLHLFISIMLLAASTLVMAQTDAEDRLVSMSKGGTVNTADFYSLIYIDPCTMYDTSPSDDMRTRYYMYQVQDTEGVGIGKLTMENGTYIGIPTQWLSNYKQYYSKIYLPEESDENTYLFVVFCSKDNYAYCIIRNLAPDYRQNKNTPYFDCSFSGIQKGKDYIPFTKGMPVGFNPTDYSHPGLVAQPDLSEYKSKKKLELTQYLMDGDSDESFLIVEKAKKFIDDYVYDSNYPEHTNKAAIDEIVTNAKQLVTNQRKEELNGTKAEAKTEINSQREADDSQAISDYIDSMLAEVDAIEFDKDKSIELQITAVKSVFSGLAADLLAMRMEEFVDYKNMCNAMLNALFPYNGNDDILHNVSRTQAIIDNTDYDPSMTLSENKAAIDALVNICKEECTTVTGIKSAATDGITNNATYNIVGQRVGSNANGIVISGGKKQKR